jgi:predicted MFS family arabinose efflux permease
MDPELKRELDQIHALARDTHSLLRTVRRHQLLEFYGKWVLYLILILGGGFFLFQYFEPIISQFTSPSSEFQKLLHSYQTGQG